MWLLAGLTAVLGHPLVPTTLDGVSPSWSQPSAPIDTSSWVGAAYTPWRASNELWWTEYESYRGDIQRELGLIKEVLGFNTLRVFLHSMLYEADAPRLQANLDDFLGLCDAAGFRVGVVFFDDCWNWAGANLSHPCVVNSILRILKVSELLKSFSHPSFAFSPQGWGRLLSCSRVPP